MINYKNINLENLELPNIELSVVREIKKQFPKNTFSQREYLYYLFTNKNELKIIEAQKGLFQKSHSNRNDKFAHRQ